MSSRGPRWLLTAADAELLAEEYSGHPAAPWLLLEAVNGPSAEGRDRSWAALRCLDPARPVTAGALYLGERCPPWAEALGAACAEIGLYLGSGDDRVERERLAGLIVALCREAQRIRALREAEAAA